MTRVSVVLFVFCLLPLSLASPAARSDSAYLDCGRTRWGPVVGRNRICRAAAAGCLAPTGRPASQLPRGLGGGCNRVGRGRTDPPVEPVARRRLLVDPRRRRPARHDVPQGRRRSHHRARRRHRRYALAVRLPHAALAQRVLRRLAELGRSRPVLHSTDRR